MSKLTGLLTRVRRTFSRRRFESEMEEEMRHHIEAETERRIALGEDPATARRRAAAEFGSVDARTEEVRDGRLGHQVEQWGRDLRYALRQFTRSKRFTGVVMLTLGLGIGTTSAIFSIVETYLLRPLPYANAGQLVSIQFEQAGGGGTTPRSSIPEIEDLRDSSGVFEEVSMVFPMNGNLTGIEKAQRVEAMAVNTSFFRLLGASAALGRTFGAEEEQASGWAEGCVLSHDAWQNHFGGDPAILERKIWLDYDTYRIIGVMPPNFRHPGRTLTSDADIWFTGGMRTGPFGREPNRARRIVPGLIARVHSDLTLTEAQAKLELFAADLRRQFPDHYPAEARWTPQLQSLQKNLVGDTRPVLWMLFGAVLLVLLICCATLANLLLVRGEGRRHELSIRGALGASRSAIVRQLVLESLLLAMISGFTGLLLAWALPPLLVEMAPVDLPRVNPVSLNTNVLIFTFGVAGLTGLLFGLIPAWQASKIDLVNNLKTGAIRSGDGKTRRLHTGFAAAQVALSLILLAGGSVLLKSFWKVVQIDPGFDVNQAVAANIWLPPPSDPNANQNYRSHENRVTLFREILRRLGTLPGVQSIAIGAGQSTPFDGELRSAAFTVEESMVTPETSPTAAFAFVSPGYFETLGIPLHRGRIFTESDNGENPVAIINAATAHRFWTEGDAIGRRFARGRGDDLVWYTVVGIVGNVKSAGLDSLDVPQIYEPVYQRSALGVTVFIRASNPSAPWAEPIRREIQGIDPDLPVFGVRALMETMSETLAHRRFSAFIIAAFASVALALAGLGIYGVVALTVSQRTREFGIRMALGATQRQMLILIFRQGLMIATIGGGLGLVGSLIFVSGIRGLLFDTSPFDPIAFGATIILLTTVALIACWLPARRAARVDPAEALRAE